MRWLLAAARWKPLGHIFQFLFIHMNHLLPVERLCENADWLALLHPQPDYPLHILILPTRGTTRLSDVCRVDPGFYNSLFEVVRELIERFDLDTYGYRLITNGGPNQSIPIWHWHLVSENWEAESG